MPVARALTGAHSTCLYLASFAQQPEIQLLVSRGQIVSGVLPLLTDRQTHRRTTIILVLEIRSCTNTQIMPRACVLRAVTRALLRCRCMPYSLYNIARLL